MIYTLYGDVFEVDRVAGYVVIDCGGVGYRLTVNERTISKLPQPAYDASGEVKGSVPVRVYTYLAVREDDAAIRHIAGEARRILRSTDPRYIRRAFRPRIPPR